LLEQNFHPESETARDVPIGKRLCFQGIGTGSP
jgi:hypothetical protein